MRIAIIQPYFFPYAGYFRLLTLCDHLVFFDCVQFPRRGYVHRNQVQDAQGKRHWFNLPLKKQAQATTIRELKFHEQAIDLWENQMLLLENHIPLKRSPELRQHLAEVPATPLEKIVDSCELSAQYLNIKTQWSFSSALKIDKHLKGQQRIIEICHQLGATAYLNPPGGKDLYQADEFAEHNIRLGFLTNYRGRYDSILSRLADPIDESLREEFYHPNNQTIEWTRSRVKSE